MYHQGMPNGKLFQMVDSRGFPILAIFGYTLKVNYSTC